jgi:hypothetical protein
LRENRSGWLKKDAEIQPQIRAFCNNPKIIWAADSNLPTIDVVSRLPLSCA